ncbi:MAG TPA: aldo/keto reductase [Patescibacteria group bacterium]|nr:aldo/keto reductase [Patescibacteria group bacterium]
MKYRTLGKTGFHVSEIGYGSWSLGADWGDVSKEQGLKTLQSVVDNDINFIDTADVYGDGRSEKIIAEFKKLNKKPFYVATKAGRRLNPHTAEGYTRENLFKFVERSLENLQTDCLDLLQLHCPPTQVYYNLEVFKALDELVEKKKIHYYGASVEKVEEAMKAIEYPNLATIQIIFNMFRQRPMELFFKEALKRNIGIIVRVPLASGLLTGKINKNTKFAANDHRQFNRHGESFDVGETFAGVDFETGLRAVEKLEKIKPQNFTMSQFALKWILLQPAVSTVIAGGKTPEQILENSKASELPRLGEEVLGEIKKIYSEDIKPQVHYKW